MVPKVVKYLFLEAEESMASAYLMEEVELRLHLEAMEYYSLVVVVVVEVTRSSFILTLEVVEFQLKVEEECFILEVVLWVLLIILVEAE